MPRGLGNFALLALVLAAFIQQADAAFHLVLIAEVYPGAHAFPNAQYVMLQAVSSFQNFLAGHAIHTFNPDGTRGPDFGVFSRNATNSASGARYLMATQQAAILFSLAPDGVATGRLPFPNGKVCFAPYLYGTAGYVDCVAYGDFTENNAGYGRPAPALVTQRALQRLAFNFSIRNNATDFAIRPPNPTSSASGNALRPDRDGDGIPDVSDCDDTDPLVFPGATEICDGRDQDCDGAVDEGFGVGSACTADADACHQVNGTRVCRAYGDGTVCEGTLVPHDVVPPGILCPPDVILECPATAAGLGTASAEDACDPAPAIGHDVSDPLPPGTTVVTWTATDASGNLATCGQTASVVDITPPEISVALDPMILWPPNHRLVDVSASVSTDDACDAALGRSPQITLVSVASDEPDDAAGAADGYTLSDVQGHEVGTADLHTRLRAERDGSGDGRLYTLTYDATDGSGNVATAQGMVLVPHDQGSGEEPVLISVAETNAGSIVTWSAAPGALRYDVVRGSVRNLRETRDAIDLGPVVCVEASSLDLSTSGHEDGDVPALDEAFLYLVANSDGFASSGYGTASTSRPRVVASGDCR